MSQQPNVFHLLRQWQNFAYDNPEKISPKHAAIYLFSIDHCNRLGWKEKFKLPTAMAMEATGINSWKTYWTAFEDLVEWGFFDLVQKSKNQYSSNVVRLCKKSTSGTQALDRAFIKHDNKDNREEETDIGSEMKWRVEGVPIPKPLRSDEFLETWERYLSHVWNTFQKRFSIEAKQGKFKKLLQYQNDGHNPKEILDQVITDGNKRIYIPDNYEKSVKEQSKHNIRTTQSRADEHFEHNQEVIEKLRPENTN